MSNGASELPTLPPLIAPDILSIFQSNDPDHPWSVDDLAFLGEGIMAYAVTTCLLERRSQSDSVFLLAAKRQEYTSLPALRYWASLYDNFAVLGLAPGGATGRSKLFNAYCGALHHQDGTEVIVKWIDRLIRYSEGKDEGQIISRIQMALAPPSPVVGTSVVAGPMKTRPISPTAPASSPKRVKLEDDEPVIPQDPNGSRHSVPPAAAPPPPRNHGRPPPPSSLGKNPISVLNEWFNPQGKKLIWDVQSMGEQHMLLWTAHLSVEGDPIKTSAMRNTKKAAQAEAARLACVELYLLADEP